MHCLQVCFHTDLLSPGLAVWGLSDQNPGNIWSLWNSRLWPHATLSIYPCMCVLQIFYVCHNVEQHKKQLGWLSYFAAGLVSTSAFPFWKRWSKKSKLAVIWNKIPQMCYKIETDRKIGGLESENILHDKCICCGEQLIPVSLLPLFRKISLRVIWGWGDTREGSTTWQNPGVCV